MSKAIAVDSKNKRDDDTTRKPQKLFNELEVCGIGLRYREADAERRAELIKTLKSHIRTAASVCNLITCSCAAQDVGDTALSIRLLRRAQRRATDSADWVQLAHAWDQVGLVWDEDSMAAVKRCFCRAVRVASAEGDWASCAEGCNFFA